MSLTFVYLTSSFRQSLSSTTLAQQQAPLLRGGMKHWWTILGVTLMRSTTTTTTATTPPVDQCLAPEHQQDYPVLQNVPVSSDSHILTIGLPSQPQRTYLGWEPYIPTCLSVSYSNNNESEGGTLTKSYSPISHPNQPDWFQLLVKAYPPQPGGGVGAYLCNLKVGDTLQAKVKSPRTMHGSPAVVGRWKHVGLVAGGTGIAPLYQILVLLLRDDPHCDTIHVLSINRQPEDILLKSELDQLARDYLDRVKVTYSLTGSDNEDDPQFQMGRGTVALAQQALPDPSLPDVMVLVCGKDGFVHHWSGPVGRAPPLPNGAKGPKIQGPLLGILKKAGYTESQVFKY